MLPRAARAMAVAANGPGPAGARAAPAVGAVLDLQLLVLGKADVRRPVRCAIAQTGASSLAGSVPDRRDRRQEQAAAQADATARASAPRRGALDQGTPGSGWLVGRRSEEHTSELQS